MTAAENLLAMYDIKKRSHKTLDIINCLLYTLNENMALSQGLQNIHKLLNLDVIDDKTARITSLVQIPEMVGLRDNENALRLAIEVYPYVKNTDTWEKIVIAPETMQIIFNYKHKNYSYARLKAALKAINSIDLGYKLLQKPRDGAFNELYIVKYNDKESLLANLKDCKLMSPNLLDKLL